MLLFAFQMAAAVGLMGFLDGRLGNREGPAIECVGDSTVATALVPAEGADRSSSRFAALPGVVLASVMKLVRGELAGISESGVLRSNIGRSRGFDASSGGSTLVIPLLPDFT